MNGTGITFDSNSLQTSTIITNTIDHASIGNKNAPIYPLAHANRATIPYINYTGKTITASGMITASSIAALDTALDTFRGYFNTKEANLDIDYAGGTRRYIATVVGLDIQRPGGLAYALFTVTFACARPFGQNTSTTSLYNIVVNSNFEVDTSGWTADGDVTITADSTTPYTGSKACKLVVTAGSHLYGGMYYTSLIPVNAGATYTYSAYVNAPAGQVGNIKLETSNSSGTIQRTLTQNFTGTGSYQRITITVTTTTSEVNVRPSIYTGTEPLTFYVDAIQIEQNSSASAYAQSGVRTSASATDALSFLGTAPLQLPIITITFTALSGSTTNTVSLTNVGTTEKLSITRAWTAGDVLVIDSDQLTVTVNGTSIDFTGAFPKFAPGSQSLAYADDFTSRTLNISAAYAPRWL